MKVVVIDGQGGRIGQLIVEAVVAEKLCCELYAIGTNSIATSAMLKGGAPNGATGENPVVVACREAEVIIGPIGMISAGNVSCARSCASVFDRADSANWQSPVPNAHTGFALQLLLRTLVCRGGGVHCTAASLRNVWYAAHDADWDCNVL